MNQLRDWNGECQRCMAEADSHIMSMFDVALICMTCWELEQKHPKYEAARSAESEEVKRGNLNFKGVGLPSTVDKKRCWVVVGDVVRDKADNSKTGTVTSINAGSFATWVEVLWNDGTSSPTPIETVEAIVEDDD